jgi:2-phosphosulfolactate phosphatase
MLLEVSLTPALYPYRTLTSHHATVAIDVLRATTAVCAAFQAGCREVVPLDSLEALEPYREQGYAIAAERGGRKLPGSDYGNSPTEYMGKDMRGVRLAYSTTNGTISILRGADAELTLVGAFANLDVLCRRLEEEGRDVVLLCSGWQNDFCLEDTLVAGAIIEKLTMQDSGHEAAGDAAHMAVALWRQAGGNPFDYCREASHVHRLQGFGPQAQADIEFAFRQNTCSVVPMLKKGVLTL